MTKRLRVALLFGGRSGEHEVSAESARHVAAAMDPARYEVIPIGISRRGEWLLPSVSRKVLEGAGLEIPEVAFEAEGEPFSFIPAEQKAVVRTSENVGEEIGGIDVVFPVLHGPYGEDGTIQGLLEIADLPYVGAGVLGSAVGMDKEKMKLLFSSAGLRVGPHVVLRALEWQRDPSGCISRIEDGLPFPVFTKPSNLGSSVGIAKCRDRAQLLDGIEDAFRYDRKVVVEEMVTGREIECGVLGHDEPEASVCGEVLPGRDFYDYADKYLEGASRTVIPAELPAEVSEEIRRQAIAAFKVIDASGMARVDFFYSAEDGITINEINTIPGFTTISMFPKLWEASGVDYSSLIDRLIELAIQRHAGKPRPEEIPPPV